MQRYGIASEVMQHLMLTGACSVNRHRSNEAGLGYGLPADFVHHAAASAGLHPRSQLHAASAQLRPLLLGSFAAAPSPACPRPVNGGNDMLQSMDCMRVACNTDTIMHGKLQHSR